MRYRLTKILIMTFSVLQFVNVVTAGEKWKIIQVTFEGNHSFSERRLHRLMVSRPLKLFIPSYYREDLLENDIDNLELFYHQNGYLEAEIFHYKVRSDSFRHEVTIHIVVTEGNLTHIEGISYFNNRIYTDNELSSVIALKTGYPFKRKQIDNAVLDLLKFYANHAYVEAEVFPDIRVNSDKHLVLIDFKFDEGNQYSVHEIQIRGLSKTHPNVVQRELVFQPGELINYTRLLESQRRLYLTGLFKSVTVRPQEEVEEDSTQKDIFIDLEENLSGELNISMGYETLEKFRVKAEIINTNLMGTARKLGFTAWLSFINYGLGVSFTEPWTFGSSWRTDITGDIEYQKEPGYNLNRIGAKMTVGRTFLKRSTVMLTYRNERNSLSEIRVSPVPEELVSHIHGFKITGVYDTRNNIFNPAKGFYFEWGNEVADNFLKHSSSFFRTVIRMKFFYSVGLNTFGSSLEGGWMDSFSRFSSIPLHERFYTGGPKSLRGFSYQKVGPLDEKRIPMGGRLKLVWNILEIRRTVYKMVGMVVFWDMGNVWQNPHHFRSFRVRSSPGVGIQFNTPIGLVRLDYGFNLWPEESEPKGRFFLTMGQPF